MEIWISSFMKLEAKTVPHSELYGAKDIIIWDDTNRTEGNKEARDQSRFWPSAFSRVQKAVETNCGEREYIFFLFWKTFVSLPPTDRKSVLEQLKWAPGISIQYFSEKCQPHNNGYRFSKACDKARVRNNQTRKKSLLHNISNILFKQDMT